MRKWIVNKWDMFIYLQFYKVVERWRIYKPHYLYFIHIYMKRYYHLNKVDAETKKLAEQFLEVCEEDKYKDAEWRREAEIAKKNSWLKIIREHI